MVANYSVQQSDGKELEEELVTLWSTNFRATSRDAARAKLHHSYKNNPAGCTQVFTVHAANALKPVGTQSLLPRAYEYQGRALSAAALVDYVVDVGHRTLGPAMLMLRRSTEAGTSNFDFVYGTPNKLAEPVLKRAGARVVGSTRRYTKVQRSAPYLRQRLPALVATLTAYLLNPSITCLDMLRRMRGGARLAWREVNSSDPVFEQIWQDRPPHLLLTKRTPDVLTWRYPSNETSAPWRFWIASDGQDSPLGYVVWRQVDRLAQISDFFCRAPESNLCALLVSFCWAMRGNASIAGVSASFFGSQLVIDAIRDAGFRPSKGGQPIVVAARMPEAVPPASAWYFTPFDEDAD